MPFGLVFGAVVFTVLSLWFGVRSMRVGVSAILRNGFDGPAVPVLISGIVLVVLGLSLSVGLVRRSRLARWTGFWPTMTLSLTF